MSDESSKHPFQAARGQSIFDLPRPRVILWVWMFLVKPPPITFIISNYFWLIEQVPTLSRLASPLPVIIDLQEPQEGPFFCHHEVPLGLPPPEVISSLEDHLVVEGLFLQQFNRLDCDLSGFTSLKKGKFFDSTDNLVNEGPEVVGSFVKFFLRHNILPFFFKIVFPESQYLCFKTSTLTAQSTKKINYQ